ncbi:hypothetical protein NS115_18915 [Paenibacillus jamilae]|uniref:Uncharacterized protein n=1 Tax=Paenibacillus jamilae TaxID=114136 RepID=A0ACC4ZSE3_9BACL|nr:MULTISPECIES: hypothetical protein [Paenibacillus]AUO06179.1 hypothetical protein C0638_06325 [Paenibacillus sp. lzh-N1]KAF6583682.1 hypothetical protein G9G57_11880 [Paenibacillus sp. EKM211P]KTS80652.1 hypothetical protein NS115_18915 [Paenibacillus jamilae]
MARSREYATTITASPYQLLKMSEAQRVALESGNFRGGSANTAAIVAGLSGITATVLGLIFVASTPVGVAMGIASLASSLFAAGTGSTVENVISNGIAGIDKINNQIALYGERYDLYQIKFPFLEYTLQDGTVIRFISGNGVVQKAHSGNGWEVF